MSKQRDDNIPNSGFENAQDPQNLKGTNGSDPNEYSAENVFSDIFAELDTQIPSKPVVEIASTKTSNNYEKIDNYNNAIVSMYLQGEETHLKSQKPVSIIVAVAVGLQVIVFNLLIYLVISRNYDVEKLKLLLDFMKYYTGAVIVEMLGLCLIVIRGVFSMSIGKMVDHILKKNRK